MDPVPPCTDLKAHYNGQPRSYGFIDDQSLDAIRRINALPSADLSKLDPEDKQCIICRAYGEDEEADTTHHQLLQLPCGHVLGMSCLHIWMGPFYNYHLHGNPNAIPQGSRFFKPGSNTCLFCSYELYPAITKGTDILIMRARLRIWDSVYACCNIPLTDEDKEVRMQLTYFSHMQHHIAMKVSCFLQWNPRAVHRDFFLGICQFMVLYAEMLITHPEGCSNENWELAQAFLKHYRAITALENYNPELWFNPSPWICQFTWDRMVKNDTNSEALLPYMLTEGLPPESSEHDARVNTFTFNLAKKIYFGRHKFMLPMP